MAATRAQNLAHNRMRTRIYQLLKTNHPGIYAQLRAQAVEDIERREANLAPIEMAPAKYRKGRVCRANGCGVGLSVYNGGGHCAIHARELREGNHGTAGR